MLELAFKNATAGGNWSKLIAWKTGGKFSHVEIVLDEHTGFSSREGTGCSIAPIDFSDPMWTRVSMELPADAEERIRGFCIAMSAAKVRYDYLGLLGIGTGHGEHDDHDRFCSEVCSEAFQRCAGFWADAKIWLIDPNKLYEMVKPK